MIVALLLACLAVDYPLSYIRQPNVEGQQPNLPLEVGRRYSTGPGELCLLEPGQQPRVLVNSEWPILEQRPSLDGQSIYYVRMDPTEWRGNVRPSGGHQGGSEIWRYDLATDTAAVVLSKPGVNYLSPIELPGGYMAYTSNERQPQIDIFKHDIQSLYIARLDGSEPMLVSEHQLASVLSPEYHPMPETGQVHLMTSTHEPQARRRGLLWGVWTHTPDFSHWAPIFSAFSSSAARHFHGTGRDGEGAFWWFTISYYQVNNEGFGRLYVAPRQFNGAPTFEHLSEPPVVVSENIFSPTGRVIPATWSRAGDQAAKPVDPNEPWNALGVLRVGKLTHPAATPDGKLLLVWSPGPVNSLRRPESTPKIQSGIYAAALGVEYPEPTAVDGVVVPPSNFDLVVDDPAFSEYMPRAVVSFEDLYGFSPEPYQYQHETPLLPKGSPYGILGGGWINRQEARPMISGNGDDETTVYQGYSVPHEDSDVEWLQFLQMEIPREITLAKAKRPDDRSVDTFGERYQILGKIPAKHPDGSPVTRWAVKLPADIPIGMATLDANERVLSWSATWKKVEAGAVYDKGCVGCHTHTALIADPLSESINQPLPTSIPALNGSGEQPIPEWHSDVKPIWESKCATCHESESPIDPGAPQISLITRYAEDDSNSASYPNQQIVPHKSRISSLYTRLVTEDLTERMPKSGDPLTAEEIDTIARWIDYGLPIDHSGDGFEDTTPPSLNLHYDGTTLRVGAWDLNGVSQVQVVGSDGTPLLLSGPVDGVWSADASGKITAKAVDTNGLETVLEQTLSSPPEPPSHGHQEQIDRLIQARQLIEQAIQELE